MNPPFPPAASWIATLTELVPAPLLDAALQGTAAIALAALVCLVWRAASAAERHRVWLLGLVAAGLWPLLSLLWPDHRPALGGFLARDGASVPAPTPIAPSPVHEKSPHRWTPVSAGSTADIREPAPAPRASVARPAPRFSDPPVSSAEGRRVGFVIWSLGATAMLMRSAGGRWRLRRLRREGRAPRDPGWNELLIEVAGRLGHRRAVELLVGRADRVPMTFGVWRPVLLLPAGAEAWSPDRRRAVLAHELGHVRRRDCLTQSVAEVVRALHWFNPLVWLAAHRLRVEREFACDDLVLEAGWKATDYAEHLVDLVESAPGAAVAGALGVGHRSRIEARVAAIVAASPRARRVPGRVASVLLLAGLAVGGWACPRVAETPAAKSEGDTRSTASQGGAAAAGHSAAESRGDRLEVLRREVDKRRARMHQIEDSLAQAREELRIAETPTGELVVREGSGTADAIAARLGSVRSELIRVQATLERLRNLDPASLRSVLLTLQADDQMLQHLCLRQADADLELARIRAELGESHPDCVRARTAVDLLERKIAERIRGILEGLEAKRATFADESKQLEEDARRSESEAIVRTRAYREYLRLREQWAAEKQIFEALFRELQDGQVEAALGPVEERRAHAGP